jgi:predicted enzyme related to lactoylglutathione lyase
MEEGATLLERNGYIAGVPCWVDTAQPDPDAAVAFYSGLFGWEFVDRSQADSGQRYFVAQLRGRDVAGVGSQPEPAPPRWNTYVSVESADATAAKVKAAGGSVLGDPFDIPGAGRMALARDPSGAGFCVWQAGEHKGAQLVNEPGSWNFSELNTPDVDVSKAFYGEVFGWEGDESGMWRLPGYGDFLELSDPELRARQAEVEAPPGFEDVVAWLLPAEGDTPPHWSITFAVDDADAVAERAPELGGTVLVPPMDAPWVRMTVIRDPQGAAFTASKFTPPTGDIA